MPKSFSTYVWLTIIYLMVSGPSAALASESKAPVKLVTGDNYFPFADASVPEKGWSVAVVKAVFARMNAQVGVDVLPWRRGYVWTLDHHYLATFPYVYTKERSNEMLYSDPINTIDIRLFVAPDSDITKVEHIVEKRLCLPLGYTISNSVGSLQERYKLVITRAADTQGCFAQVEKGWSDIGVVNDYFQPEHMRQRYGLTRNFPLLPGIIDSVKLYLIVAKTYPDAAQWITQFNTQLALMRESKEYEKLGQNYRDWLQKSAQPQQP